MSPFSRRQVLTGSAAILGLGALAACSPDEQATTPDPQATPSGSEETSTQTQSEAPTAMESVKVGYIADGNGATLVNIAEQQGLWAKHGLEAETLVFTNGPLQIQALGTGDIDFGYIGFGALWLPMSGQAKVVSVNSNGQADRIVAQPGIASVEDLRGRTVGVPEGTSGDILLSLALEAAGMTVDDIKRVAMDPPTAVSAFISGQVDAVGIWYPHVDTIMNQKPDAVELVKSGDFPELAFPACQVAAPDITERPELLAKFQAVQKEAFTWAVDNRDQLTSQLAEFLDIPEDSIASEQEFVEVLSPDQVLEMSSDGTLDTWFTTLNEHFVDAGKLESVVPITDYWLASEYEQA